MSIQTAESRTSVRHPLDPLSAGEITRAVLLQPFGFFDQNPTLTLPRPGEAGHCHGETAR
jgi:Cu2+-containing amine oxidase